jgi:hypothetical protein
MTALAEVDLAQRHRELWFRGHLRHLTREGPQRQLYDMIHARDRSAKAFGPHVWNLHRRFGKTFLSLLIAIEACLRQPKRFVKFVGPSQTQIADILGEHWAIIWQDAPEELVPSAWRGEKYTFRNPRWERERKGKNRRYLQSFLRLYGVGNDDGNKMRGGSTDVAVMDECREFPNLSYTWGSVLLPTFKGREDRLAIMLSTPPDDIDHPWASKYKVDAEDRGRYVCIPGSKDPNWGADEDEMMAREMGGRDTPQYQREIECKLIGDSTRLVIPEFVEGDFETDELCGNQYLHETWKRPSHYHAYAVADGGGADYTGVLFAFVDFEKRKIVVEDELFCNYTPSEEISRLWQLQEGELFNADRERLKGREVVSLERRCETTTQQLIDLRRIHGLDALPVAKHDKDAARNFLRTCFRRDEISINVRCKDLIHQLRNGQRTKRGDFQRTERMGHLDLIAALIHLRRVVDLDQNPFPPAPRKSPTEVFHVPTYRDEIGWNRYFRRRA